MSGPATRVIRAYVDEELARDERLEFEVRLREDPSLVQQVQFERELRLAVARVLEGAAPQELTERLRDVLRDEPAVAGSLPLSSTPRRWFDAPRRASLFYIAASLAVVAGAVAFGILGPRIDSVGRFPVPQFRAETAVFASEEHNRSASMVLSSSRPEEKSDRETTAQQLIRAGLDPALASMDLSQAGYRVYGLCDCQLPSAGRSSHLLFRRIDPLRSPAMASLFIFQDQEMTDSMPVGQWIVCDGGSRCSHLVLRMTDGRQIYLLVCCDERDLESVAQEVGRALP